MCAPNSLADYGRRDNGGIALAEGELTIGMQTQQSWLVLTEVDVWIEQIDSTDQHTH